MREIIAILIIIIILVVIFGTIVIGVNRTERYECSKWQKYAEKYPDFYLTEWQDAQCRYAGIEINAPIK